ncbi:MAG: glycosyltransferase family 2 protein [Clostridiales bacterium]|nr:glycosyltransferase family 2 protein [Clostridiales bacterium]
MTKLLSVAIPCYNSQDYIRRAVDSLLSVKDQIEILIINDGSTDDTARIAEEYASEYPDTVRLINKENGGHGDAVMTGINEACGLYFRVLDSDDWVERDALISLIKVLDTMAQSDSPVDLVITNYVYEKVLKGRSRSINYRRSLPCGRVFGWDEVGHFSFGSYILMHSATYRTDLLRTCGMVLPKHTFYVDHIYVLSPMTKVETMYYLDVDLYRYFIGREDQSVNEKVMLSRMDQQLKVNRILLYDLGINDVVNANKLEYLQYYVEIITMATVAFYLRKNTKEDEKAVDSFLDEIELRNPVMYRRFTRGPFYQHPIGALRRMPHRICYPLYRFGYNLMRRIFSFN